MTPEERSLRSRLAAHSSWGKTTDVTARTAPAGQALSRRFEVQVDPDGKLDPGTRTPRRVSPQGPFREDGAPSAVSRRKAVEARTAVVRLSAPPTNGDAELASTRTDGTKPTP